jgi:hypothetical protein
LAALKAKMAVKGSPSEDIVLAFIKQHQDAIARENSDLVYIALMKLIGHVGSVSTRGTSAAQIEMFTEYAVPRTVLFLMPDGSKQHRQVLSLTTDEGRQHIENRTTKPRSRAPTEIKELARLLDDVEPRKKTAKSNKIGDCWVAFQEARGG